MQREGSQHSLNSAYSKLSSVKEVESGCPGCRGSLEEMDLLCKVETVVGEVYWRWSVFSTGSSYVQAEGDSMCKVVTISIASLQTVEHLSWVAI